MAYTPTVWQTGDVVSSARLNKLEGGVHDNSVAIEGLDTDVSALKSQISEVEAGFPQKSASGSIVTIEDGADNVPVVSLEAEINPVQDLHGYENPWPAGGGKNYFNPEAADSASFSRSGETFTNTQTDSREVFIPMAQALNGTTVIASSTSATGSYPNRTIFAIEITSEVTSLRIKHNGQTRDLTITIPFTKQGHFMVSFLAPQTDVQTVGGLVIKDIMVADFDYYTPWVPYSNICPISGFTEVDVSVTGVNVWDEEWEVGSLDTATGQNASSSGHYRSKNYIPIIPNGSYRVIMPTANSQFMIICFYDAAKNYTGYIYKSNNTTFSRNARYARFVVVDGGATYHNDISINYPYTDTDYHAYNGSVTTIEFPDEAGTVYGGSLRLNQDGTADLTVKKDKYVFTGSETWYYQSGFFFAYPLGDGVAKGSYVRTENGVLAYQYKDYGQIRVYLDSNPFLTEDTDMAAFMATYGFVYELATPVTYHIENVDLVKTLYGLNNIWADTGDIDVTYRCDPATYTAEQIRLMLNAMVAPVEPTTTASKAYSVNEFLIYNNVLYKVDAPIANGGTITIGTNVHATTVGAELTAILNS